MARLGDPDAGRLALAESDPDEGGVSIASETEDGAVSLAAPSIAASESPDPPLEDPPARRREPAGG